MCSLLHLYASPSRSPAVSVSIDRHVCIAINPGGVFETEESSGKSLSYIVGGSSGMGLATVRLLVAVGGTVVLVGREQDNWPHAGVSSKLVAKTKSKRLSRISMMLKR
jgi:hypothetical protein